MGAGPLAIAMPTRADLRTVAVRTGMDPVVRRAFSVLASGGARGFL
jgi:hypothetical protein